MALNERIASDNTHLFMNTEHFATSHTWNGVPFTCVTDEEMSVKRRIVAAYEVGWQDNAASMVVYVPKESFPGRAMPNETGFFDRRQMRIISVNEDMGMLTLVMLAFDPKAVGYEEY